MGGQNCFQGWDLVEGAMFGLDGVVFVRILFNVYARVRRGTDIRLAKFKDDIKPIYIYINILPILKLVDHLRSSSPTHAA